MSDVEAGAMCAQKEDQSAYYDEHSTKISIINELICREFGITIANLFKRTHGLAIHARCRNIALYLARTYLGLPLACVGKHYQRGRSTICAACQLIEDLRDDPVFDARIEYFEERIKDRLS